MNQAAIAGEIFSAREKSSSLLDCELGLCSKLAGDESPMISVPSDANWFREDLVSAS
jgi:hypothetical protein